MTPPVAQVSLPKAHVAYAARCLFLTSRIRSLSTRAPTNLRPLSGPPRPELAQIDGLRTSKYNKGFTRDGGAEVGASFTSGLFLVAKRSLYADAVNAQYGSCRRGAQRLAVSFLAFEVALEATTSTDWYRKYGYWHASWA